MVGLILKAVFAILLVIGLFAVVFIVNTIIHEYKMKKKIMEDIRSRGKTTKI